MTSPRAHFVHLPLSIRREEKEERMIRSRRHSTAFCSILAVILLLFGCGEIQSGQNGAPEGVVFTVEPDEVDRNGSVTLRWSVPDTQTVTIQLRYGSYKQEAERAYSDLPPSGEMTVDLTRKTVDGRVDTPYIHTVSFWLLKPGEGSSAWTPGLTYLTGVGVKIRCPFDDFFFGKDPYYDFCPLTEAQKVTGVYAPFEHGFLLWRSDRDTVYVLRVYGDQTAGLAQSALAFPPLPDAPRREYPRDPVFDPLLSSGHGIIIGIGAQTEPATAYEMTVQDSYNDTLYDSVSYMSLPDGRVIRFLTDIYDSAWMCMIC